MTSPRRRRPPAWKHGLASRAPREAMSAAAEVLADALLGTSPREPQLLEAAREAAEAILYLETVRQLQCATLEAHAIGRLKTRGRAAERMQELSVSVKVDDAPTWRRLRDTVAATIGGAREGELERPSQKALALELKGSAAELRRLADYERRAFSRRQKAIRRLDYERIEAERRGADLGAGHR